MAESTGFDWGKWLPLILGGASTAAGIVGGVKQAGAIDKATEYNAQAAKNALALMAGMFALEHQNKAPYRALGTMAMPGLMRMSKVSGELPKTADQGAPMSKSLADVFRSANIPLPASAGATSEAGLAGALAGQPGFSDIPTSGIHSRLGGVASRASAGAGLGSLYGSVVPGVGTAVGTGLGAAYGGLAGLFDNNNSDKDFASTGINRVSDWVWKELMPKVRAGEIAPQDAELAFNDVWGKWEGSMRNTPGFNSGVADRSITSQRQYFQPFFDQINQLKQGVA